MAVTTNQALILPDGTDSANVPLSFTDYNSNLENRLVQRYLSAADRTARNAAPNEGELSYLTDVNLLQKYNGATWESIISDIHQAQELSITFAAATSYSQAVVFPVAFTTAPNVHTNIASGAAATAQWNSRAISVTTTGFTLFLFTPAGATAFAAIPVQWSAFLRT